jgi:hypothetical protein
MADHPITISNGSPLMLDHDSWNWDTEDDRHLGTTVHHNTVTLVTLTSNGNNVGSIPFNGEPLSIHVTYSKASRGAIVLDVVTLPNGRDPVLTVDPNSSLSRDFTRNGTQFVSNDHVTITGLTIKKGAADVTPAGHFPKATVTIDYK